MCQCECTPNANRSIDCLQVSDCFSLSLSLTSHPSRNHLGRWMGGVWLWGGGRERVCVWCFIYYCIFTKMSLYMIRTIQCISSQQMHDLFSCPLSLSNSKASLDNSHSISPPQADKRLVLLIHTTVHFIHTNNHPSKK